MEYLYSAYEKFSILVLLIIACFSFHAQTSSVQATIWSPDFTVNSPFNNIEAGRQKYGGQNRK